MKGVHQQLRVGRTWWSVSCKACSQASFGVLLLVVIGIFCSGLNAYCMQTGPLFLRISGSSGVLKAFLLERNRQLSCNPKKKKKKICWSKNSGSFKMSSAGMALIWCKRWGCKALKAVTFPLSLAGNCIQLMLTVLIQKRMVAPYAKALDRWCSWNTFHARRSGSIKRDTTLAWRAWICVGTSTSPTPPWAGGKELVSTLGNRAPEGLGPGKAAES